MLTLLIILSLAFLSLSSPTLQKREDDALLLPRQAPARRCIVPLILFNSLDYQFIPVAQNYNRPAIHGKQITVIRRSSVNRGDYVPTVSPFGTQRNFSFRNNRLFVGRQVAYIRNYQILFSSNLNIPNQLRIRGNLACDRNGRQITVIYPYGPGTSYTFCLMKKRFNLEFGSQALFSNYYLFRKNLSAPNNNLRQCINIQFVARRS